MIQHRRCFPFLGGGVGLRVVQLLSLGLLLAACDAGAKDDTGEPPEADADTDSDVDIDTGIGCDEAPAEVSLATADAILVGRKYGDYAGESVVGPGDVNGDGYDDLLVGAPSAQGNVGAAYLVLGPVGGEVPLSDSDAVIFGTHPDDDLGYYVDGGDVDGDGYADLLVGAAQIDPDGGAGEGAILLFRGPVSAGEHTWEGADGALAENIVPGGSVYGYSYLGDVDGDGLGDVMVNHPFDETGGWGAGAVWMVSGFTGGQVALPDDAAASIIGSTGEYLGYDSTAVGDVDGDGYDDALVGVMNPGGFTIWDSDYRRGAVWLFHGPMSGTLTEAEAAFKIVGTDYDQSAYRTHGAGDVDADGLPDIVMGSIEHDRLASWGGATWVFAGPHSGSVTVSEADWAIFGTEEDAMIGDDADIADLDEDGFDDLVVGPALAWVQGVAVFPGPLDARAAWECADALVTNGGVRSGYGPANDIVGDIDRDGALDLAFGSGWGEDYEGGAVFVFSADRLLGGSP